MKVLVTGGAGFIGSRFVIRALETRPNFDVTILDSLTYAGNLNRLAGADRDFRFVRGDIRDSETVGKLVKESDLVVNFAAESHNDNSISSPKLFWEVNAGGALNLLEACRAYDVHFHQISTDEVFGDMDVTEEGEFDEQSPLIPSSPYSASKAAAEHLVRAWVRTYGIKATISNCSNNYGPNQHSEKFIPSMIRRLKDGKPALIYGDGLNIRDWIHVDDHVDGILKILEQPEYGYTYLFGNRDRVNNLELAKALAKEIAGDSNRLLFVEDRPGHDRKYAIDPSSTEQKLNWKARKPKILDQISYLATECDPIEDNVRL